MGSDGHRPAHLRPSLVLLVALGGAVGTSARYGLATAVGPTLGWPTATFAANVLGAFLLGLLLERLVRRGPETTTARRARLTLGTGVLGGFTTFSTLAIEIERLGAAGRPGLAVVYGLLSVVVGLAVAFLGVALGARRHRSGAAAPGVPASAETA